MYLVSLALMMAIQPATAESVARSDYEVSLAERFAGLDGNGDGNLDAAEIEAANSQRAAAIMENARQRLAAQFARLDTNSDGALSLAEWQAGAPTPDIRTADPDNTIEQLDSDDDGAVTLAEFRAVQLGNFDRLDTNGDGQLSPAERRIAAQSPTGPGR